MYACICVYLIDIAYACVYTHGSPACFSIWLSTYCEELGVPVSASPR